MANTGVVAIIPARRGSKGVPLKNLRLLQGVPLVAHSIRAALGATLVDAVVVSTEDDEIAATASEHGAAVVKRPPELATDSAQNDGVVKHVLESRARADRIAVLLQPTSPLRTAAQIDACIRAVRDGARSAMTITAVEHHPGKAVIVDNGLIEPFTNDADMEARRQSLREVYRQNGAVYAIGVADFLAHGRFYLRPCRGVVVPAEDSIDIDSEMDLALAELMLARRQSST